MTKSPKQLIENVRDVIISELENYQGSKASGDLAELVGTASTLAIAYVTIRSQMKVFTSASKAKKFGTPVEVFKPYHRGPNITGFLALNKKKHFDSNGLFIPTFIVEGVRIADSK